MRKGYWIALGIFLFAASSYTLLIGGLGLHKRISTSVLDLVPKEQRDPELEAARALVQSEQNRILLLALQSNGQPISPAQRNAFLDSLLQSGAFSSVFDVAGEQIVRDSGALFFDLRGELLLPTFIASEHRRFSTRQAKNADTPAQADFSGSQEDLADSQEAATDSQIVVANPQENFADFLAREIVTRLDDFLLSPEAMAYQQLIPRDPQLLVFDAFAKWRSANAGLLQKPTENTLLVWAKLNASPFSAEGQQPVFDALDQALLSAQAQPGAEFLRLQSSGVGRFAQANEQGIRAEVAFFNSASVFFVLLVCFLFLRSFSVLLHSIALLSCSLLFAWLVTLLIFDSVPIIALVIGSVLVGVTIDYCLHVFLDAQKKVDALLLRPLLLSCGTTVIAFAVLTLSPLPLLAQTGVFVATGLAATCALALLYRALLGRYIHSKARGDLCLRHSLRWKLPAALIFIVLALGITRIDWNDSVDNLQYPLPHLRAEDAAVRALFGAGDKAMFLSSGTDFAAARTALEAFQTALPDGTQMTSLAQWTPLPQDYFRTGEFFAQFPDFPQKLKVALDAAGYETESFEPFFADWHAWQQIPFDAEGYESLFLRLQNELPGPTGSLIGSSPSARFLLLSGAAPARDFTPPQGTIKVDTLYSLSSLFARYRQNALELSLWGVLVIIVGSLSVYGLRRGALTLLVPATAGVAALGSVGYLHGQLNLFHLIGLFLGVCLALDYGAFAMRAKDSASVPFSVCVAVATTLSSFALLTLSRIPAVVALGSTVALCVVYGFVFALLLTGTDTSKKT